jgi:hypothetical protein
VTRLRDDLRFKSVGPDVLETLGTVEEVGAGFQVENPIGPGVNSSGIWFDNYFVEFVKQNYRGFLYTNQKVSRGF